MKEDMITFVLFIVCLIGIVFLIFFNSESYSSYNKRTHEDDVQITEWISPDGVHYWYQRGGYHAMLAPRYDAEGNLVIEEE